MQEVDAIPMSHHEDGPQAPIPHLTRRRLAYAAMVVLAVLLLITLPPLINMGRYQRRIATSISQSLGRPVHLDNVTFNLLPLPGFTLSNLVVEEDPAFGNEPVIRANTVTARLRLSSLWRRRFEFSTISFTDPSVNLVHSREGKWNLQSILLRASQIQAAPTAQKNAGPAPRFPYIEATGARVNLKLDEEKTPVSLTDADFALWLPDPQQWHLRIQARPTRTDTNVSDAGTLQIEGTLGRAPSLGQVPLNLTGSWRGAPLGEASLMLLGHDAGLRGELAVTANLVGTISQSAIQLHLRLNDARRADFVPERPLNVDLQCLGTASSFFHTFQDVRCSWPPPNSSISPFGPPPTPTLALTANIPDLRHPELSTAQIGTPGLPGATLLDWLRVASSRIPADLALVGKFTGSLNYRTAVSELPVGTQASGGVDQWQGQLLLAGATLTSAHAGATPLVTGDISLHTAEPATNPRRTRSGAKLLLTSAEHPVSQGFTLAPVSLELGGKDPAVLEGELDSRGYVLHLTGMASINRLQALASAVPTLGDGLETVLPTNRAAGPFRVDLTATRPWGSPQTWTDNTLRATIPAPHRRSGVR